MKIKVFQSDKGDCLLISNRHNRKQFRVLVDGGMRASYKRHVAPELFRELRLDHPQKNRRGRLNLVYVSHVDQDHISGVLQLFDDLKDWRVYDFRKTQNPNLREPDSVRPPEVESVWHNAFHEQVGDNATSIEDMLAATAQILSAATDEDTRDLAAGFQDLATSNAEAVQLSRRLGSKQLDVPLNQEFERRLMCVKDPMPPPMQLGGMVFYVIGPAVEDLELLREKWNKWLVEKEQQVRDIQRRAKQDEKDLIGTANAAEGLLHLAQSQADALKRQLLVLDNRTDNDPEGRRLRRRLGDRTEVTVPNLASLMVLIEKDGKKVLLTGDGHSADILKGLEYHDKLDQNNDKNLHVDVLKIQHHGSEHNIDVEFCQRITADHYIFCGNGEHENPDLDAVRVVLNSRLGGATEKSTNDETDNHFKIWFNSSENETEKTKAQEHMKKLRELVEARNAENEARFDYVFLDGESFFEFDLT